VIQSAPGRLTVGYQAGLQLHHAADASAPSVPGSAPPLDYERQLFLRPSRYCPSDHLIGFAVAEFGSGPDVGALVAAITRWIRLRIEYVSGAGSVHDSAEHTLLTGRGSCRDFAHLGVALCRALGIPARFTAVYAPGLAPMDFHAVFETLEAGRWLVHDPTGLAPRQSLLRIATGRDAADTAFAAVNSGVAELVNIEVSAVALPSLPLDDLSKDVELP
jgi:transglutaminase-like putative cysteine protease